MPTPPRAHGGAAGADLCQGAGPSERRAAGVEATHRQPRVKTALQPAHRHGGAGAWQHRAQQAVEPVYAARQTQVEHAVVAVLPGAQHREAGRVRSEEVAGEERATCGCQNVRQKPDQSPVRRADPQNKTSEGNWAMITNIVEALRQPAAGFWVFAQHR